MDLRESERRLGAILAGAEGWLPADQLAEMRALLAAGEPGIALENFCTQLEELDVLVPDEIIEKLTSLASGMSVKLSPWIRPRV